MAALVVGLLITGAPQAAWAAPGDLDETFSRDGRVTGAGSASSVVTQPDGSILIGGVDRRAETRADQPRARVARLNPDGSPDRSFGSNGEVKLWVVRGGGPGLLLEPDGSILVIGQAPAGFNGTSIAIARLSADGSRDPSLQQDLVLGPGVIPGEALQAVLVQPDGRIVIAAHARGESLVLRYLPDGTPDPSWGADGQVAIGERSFWATAITASTDGGYVLAGMHSGLGANGWDPSDLAVVRLDSDGALDSNFGDGGRLVADLGVADLAFALALRPDGRILVGGSRWSEPGSQEEVPLVLRLLPDGTRDPTFSSDHGRLFPSLGFPAQLTAEFTADGGTVLVTSRRHGRLRKLDFELRLLDPSGTPVSDFGRDGRAAADFGLTHDVPGATTLGPDGKIIVAGYASGRRAADGFLLARFEVAPGPADLDADLVVDGNDRCPARFARRRDGCPKLERSLSLHRGKHAHGRLRGLPPCKRRRGIRLFRAGRGRDRRIARTRTGRSGRWRIRRSLPRGRYYAVARARTVELGRCPRVESRRLRLG